MSDTPRRAAGDRPANHPEAETADARWLAIGLLSLAGLVALTLAVLSKVVFPAVLARWMPTAKKAPPC